MKITKSGYEQKLDLLPLQPVFVKFRIGKNKKPSPSSGGKLKFIIHIHCYITDVRTGSTNVISSEIENVNIENINIDGNINIGGMIGGENIIIKLVAPDFIPQRLAKSSIYIWTDKWDGVDIEDLNIVKGQMHGGLDGDDNMKFGLENFPGWPAVQAGMKIGFPPGVPLKQAGAKTGYAINEIKKLLKDKIDKGLRIDVISEGLMLGNSGFAKASRNYTYWLDKLGCNVRATILDGDNVGTSGTEIGSRVLALSRNISGDLSSDNGCVCITMNYPTGVGKHPYSYNIGYVMFETFDFPGRFVQHLNNACNEVWTPSDWGRETMVRCGVGAGVPNFGGVRAMPLGVDTKLFDPGRDGVEDRRYIAGNMIGFENKFKFLSVMGFSERKGVSVMVRAFSEEFGNAKDKDNVMLYIKAGWYNLQKAWLDINAARSGLDWNTLPLIHLDMSTYSDEVMANLYKNCDAFVLASRGEGFGLPMAESMSMGLPTIGTGWSGNTAFMNDSNSYLIRVDGFAPEPRCNWITGEYINQKFAIPSISHLRQLMRQIYENREEAKQKGLRAREWMVNNFDWSVSTQRMKNRLEEIARTN